MEGASPELCIPQEGIIQLLRSVLPVLSSDENRHIAPQPLHDLCTPHVRADLMMEACMVQAAFQSPT